LESSSTLSLSARLDQSLPHQVEVDSRHRPDNRFRRPTAKQVFFDRGLCSLADCDKT
jgi:hypothetical protein